MKTIDTKFRFFVVLTLAFWALLLTGASKAQETKAPDEAGKVEAPAAAAAPAAPAAAAPAPKLPTYFTATSEDPKKPPAWPDPTGRHPASGRRRPATARAMFRRS